MTTHRPLILGHRGSPHTATENTLASFRAAIDEGADGVELDIQTDRDGRLVLHHDTVVKGRGVWERTRDELSADLGHPVDTLPAIFAGMPADAWIFVEFKRQGSVVEVEAHHQVIQTVRARPGFDRWPERTIVGSFDPWFLRAVHHAAPTLHLGLILDPSQLPAPDLFDPEPFGFLKWLSVNESLAHGPVVERAHEAGLRTLSWTVDGPERQRRCFDRFPVLGGIITDLPREAASVRG